MKTLLLSMLILSCNGNIDNQQPTLQRELSDKMILDLSQVELHENFQDYVIVQFSICEEEVTIKSVDGTHDEVIKAVCNKLNSMEISANYEEDKIYRIKFTFEKH